MRALGLGLAAALLLGTTAATWHSGSASLLSREDCQRLRGGECEREGCVPENCDISKCNYNYATCTWDVPAGKCIVVKQEQNSTCGFLEGYEKCTVEAKGTCAFVWTSAKGANGKCDNECGNKAANGCGGNIKICKAAKCPDNPAP